MIRQPNNRIRHNLPWPVISNIPAAIAVNEINVFPAQFLRTVAQQIPRRYPPARPSVTTGICSTIKIVSAPPPSTALNCARSPPLPRLAVRHPPKINHRYFRHPQS